MFKVELLPRNLEACRRDLSHESPDVRLSVVRDLSRGAEDHDRLQRIDLLLAALTDADARIRRQALVALADLQAIEARDRVLSLLSDAQIQVRQMAVMCVGEIASPQDDEVVGRLASLLRAGDPSIRYQALIAHSQMRPADAADDLRRALKDQDAEIRELSLRLVDEVLVARGQAIPPSLREAVVTAAAEDEVPGVRLVAQILCGDLGWEAPWEMIRAVIARRVRVREPRDEQMAIQLAGKLGLTDMADDLSRRAFGRLGFSLDPFRWNALACLCRFGDRRALSKLKAALGARSPVDRTMAVKSLGESGHPEALELLRPLEKAPGPLDPDVLSEAIRNLQEESKSIGA